MEHAKVSQANPALVICAIDCSKSMVYSNARGQAFAAINALRKHANSKKKQVRLIVFGFADGIHLAYDGWCEDVTDINLGGGSQTHLKMACEVAVENYRKHVSKYCKDENPLANVLFFTDGSHTPGLDMEFPIPGAPGKQGKYWRPFDVDDWIKPIADLDNVLLGVIDYSGELPQFPPADQPIRKMIPNRVPTKFSKVTVASVLEKSLLERAYARDSSVPPPRGQSLKEVFGPMQKLEGKRFIVSSQTIISNPQVTSAFVRLGTASTFAGTNTGADIGGAYASMPLDDTFFKSKFKSILGEEE